MEKVFICENGITGESSDNTAGGQTGFWLRVFSAGEKEQLFELLKTKSQVSAEWLNELLGQEDCPGRSRPNAKTRNNEGFLKIHPRSERVGPGVTYVCYRDIDERGQERPIRFFITSSEFLLVEWSGISREELGGWAQRGLLIHTSNLAQVLGAKVLSHHQELLEKFEDQMDFIEEGILKAPKQWQQNRILALHKRVIGLKKSLNAHQSVFIRLAGLGNGEGPREWEELVQDTQRELDNVRQTHELIESLREAYQTALDNRANDIMKLLTLLATVLLPINLLTSFFGMNFDNMPLIHTSYGIIIFYAICLIILSVSLWYFRRMKWQK